MKVSSTELIDGEEHVKPYWCWKESSGIFLWTQNSMAADREQKKTAQDGIRLLDSKDLSRIDVPDHWLSRKAVEYLIPIMQLGVTHFIDNARVAALGLAVDDQVLPLLLSEGLQKDAGVCSIRSHYVDYPLEELERHKPMLRATLGVLLRALGRLVSLVDLGRVAYVNNWLWATNPLPSLSAPQLNRVAQHLVQSYPDRAVVFRSITDTASTRLRPVFRQAGFRLIRSRRVYLYDPRLRTNNNVRRDILLLKRSPYSKVKDTGLPRTDLERVTQLYRRLYLEKYSQLNLQLNQNFFEHLFNIDLFTHWNLRSPDRIEAFCSYLVQDDLITMALIGYDQEETVQTGLYRQAFAFALREARDRRLPMHLSAGAGTFKKNRGALTLTEYDAVYSRHLPCRKRAIWGLLEAMMNTWSMVEGRFF